MTLCGQRSVRYTVRAAVGAIVCGVVFAGMGLLDLGTTPGAQAEATVGFQINSVNVSPLFEFDNQGTDSLADDTLTAGPAQVALSLDLGGGVNVYPDARFEFDASLTSIEQGALPLTDVYELLFEGSFTFTDPSSNDLIMSASFTDARLLMLEFFDSGFVGFATGLAANMDVDFVLGPAVPGDLTVEGDEQFEFTVNSLLGLGGGPVEISDVPSPDNIQFENFNFSSSFSGSMAVIPEPATISLAALALLGLLVYRRRA